MSKFGEPCKGQRRGSQVSDDEGDGDTDLVRIYSQDL
jgi:hypothetical protein